jgi:hypothetical protein
MSYPILVKNIESNYFFVKEEEGGRALESPSKGQS